MKHKTPRTALDNEGHRAKEKRQKPRLRLPFVRFPGVEKLYRSIINPPADKNIEAAIQRQSAQIPTLWLLGKTGSGKSSVTQKLTGQDSVEVGNGFEPCTRFSRVYDFPHDKPVLRFLDTRGLGEAGYDPLDDLEHCEQTSHAVLAIMRLDDPQQHDLLQALQRALSTSSKLPIIVVHTHAHTVTDPVERERALLHNQQQIEKRADRVLPQALIDFSQPGDGLEPHDLGREALVQAIVQCMPELHAMSAQPSSDSAEQDAYKQVSSQITWYAGAAAATDAVPAIGLVTVPGIQGKMLHSLAGQFGVDWTRRRVTELLAALGTSILYRYSLSLAGRQLGKLIPVYGQSVGAASAASISFISTVALGRAACRYLYSVQHGQTVDPEAIKAAYKSALTKRSHS